MEDEHPKHEVHRISVEYPADINPEDLAHFIELPKFAKAWKKLGLNEDDRQALYIMIMMGPEKPPIIPGSGGLRKIRFAPRRWNTGKSGAARVCYAFFMDHSIVLLVRIYDKHEKDDLSKREINDIRELLEEFVRRLEESK